MITFDFAHHAKNICIGIPQSVRTYRQCWRQSADFLNSSRFFHFQSFAVTTRRLFVMNILGFKNWRRLINSLKIYSFFFLRFCACENVFEFYIIGVYRWHRIASAPKVKEFSFPVLPLTFFWSQICRKYMCSIC